MRLLCVSGSCGRLRLFLRLAWRSGLAGRIAHAHSRCLKDRLSERPSTGCLKRFQVRATGDSNDEQVAFEAQRFDRAHSVPGVAVRLEEFFEEIWPHFTKIVEAGERVS